MKKMKRIILIMMAILIAVSGVAIAGDNGPSGPAPNSGDGDPDGSEMDGRSGPYGSGQGEDSPGPAPNSGDGDPEGSGM